MADDRRPVAAEPIVAAALGPHRPMAVSTLRSQVIASRQRGGHSMTIRLCALIAAMVAMILHAQFLRAGSIALDSLKLLPGFSVTLYAKHVTLEIAIALGVNGYLFV